MENCNNYQERISAFIDGTLAENERLDLMEHMALCPACQAYFDDQIAIHDALTELEADAPTGFTESVMARVRKTQQDAPKRKTVNPWRQWAATAACCALAVLGAVTMGGEKNNTDAVMARSTESYSLTTASDIAQEADIETYSAQQSESPTEDAKASQDVAATSLPAGTAENARKESSDQEKSLRYISMVTVSGKSAVAGAWVAENLGKAWGPGLGYELTAEQFTDLLDVLKQAGEEFTLTPAETESTWYLVEAS